MCRWSPSCGISYALPLSVLPGKLERTDYSFVPSSLGERCFGFDAVIVVAVGLECSFVVAFAMYLRSTEFTTLWLALAENIV